MAKNGDMSKISGIRPIAGPTKGFKGLSMEISAQVEGPLCVLTPQEERIDAAVALAFKDNMRKETADAPDKVILNLGNVTFIDSSGLGAVVATMKHLAPDRQLILAGLNPNVEKVFRLTRMDQVFDIHLKLETAIAAVRNV